MRHGGDSPSDHAGGKGYYHRERAIEGQGDPPETSHLAAAATGHRTQIRCRDGLKSEQTFQWRMKVTAAPVLLERSSRRPGLWRYFAFYRRTHGQISYRRFSTAAADRKHIRFVCAEPGS